MKQSAVLKQAQAIANKEIQKYEIIRMQMAQDAAIFAANETLGMGKGRVEKFCKAFNKYVNEICTVILEASKDDKKIEYAKEIIDRKLKAIVGDELFVPYEVRYGHNIPLVWENRNEDIS